MIIEFEAGEGGEEANLFAIELKQAFKMWLSKKYKVADKDNTLETNIRLEEIENLTGIHRVQRISNDKRGRKHTSSVKVSAYQESKEAKIDVKDEDIRIDFFRGSGPGGQHRNKTSTAVRLHHYPTGITITRTSGRSQSANLQSAKDELTKKLENLNDIKAHDQLLTAKNRETNNIVGPKSFTHNQQRNETINHATGQRWRMSDFMKGKIQV